MHYTLAREQLADHGIVWNHYDHQVLTIRQSPTSYARWMNYTHYDDLYQRWVLLGQYGMSEILLLQYEYQLQRLSPFDSVWTLFQLYPPDITTLQWAQSIFVDLDHLSWPSPEQLRGHMDYYHLEQRLLTDLIQPLCHRYRVHYRELYPALQSWTVTALFDWYHYQIHMDPEYDLIWFHGPTQRDLLETPLYY